MNRLCLALVLTAAIAGIGFAQTPVVPDTSKKTAPPALIKQSDIGKEKTAAKPGLAVERAAFCTGVEEKEPVGEGTEFPAGVGKLYFWSNILNTGDATSVSHIWSLNGEEKARVSLPVKYARNRVWSSKLVPSEWVGDWKVEIVSESDETLGAGSCKVK